jgi:hypothetical protein
MSLEVKEAPHMGAGALGREEEAFWEAWDHLPMKDNKPNIVSPSVG